MLSPRMHNVAAVLLLGAGAALSLDRVVRGRLDGSLCRSLPLWKGALAVRSHSFSGHLVSMVRFSLPT